MYFAELPAAQRHILPSELLPSKPRPNHKLQPIRRRHLIDIPVVVFALQHESGFFQVSPDGCRGKEIKMTGYVLAEKMARSYAMKIRHQKYEQAILFENLRGLAKIGRGGMHVFPAGPPGH